MIKVEKVSDNEVAIELTRDLSRLPDDLASTIACVIDNVPANRFCKNVSQEVLMAAIVFEAISIMKTPFNKDKFVAAVAASATMCRNRGMQA